MVIRNEQRPVEIREKMRDGNGAVHIRHLCEEKDLPPHCRVASLLTLDKGVSIGEHPHIDEAEFYFILSGEGVVSEGGEKIAVYPGDVTLTKSGESHCIANEKDEPLVMVAFVATE
jgi:mannose-6-phosphate isomerase-like protein (cupin superfamily)